MFQKKCQQLPKNAAKEGTVDNLHKPGDHIRGLRDYYPNTNICFRILQMLDAAYMGGEDPAKLPQ